MLLKLHLNVQLDAKSCPLKREGETALFNPASDAEESVSRTTINVFEARLDATRESIPENIYGSAL